MGQVAADEHGTASLPPHGRNVRNRLDSIRQTISQVPVIEIRTSPQEEEEGPDGGWGWVVLVASFICLCVLDGVAYTFGVFLDPLLVEMGGGRGQISSAGSMLVATYAFSGPLAANLVTRFGTRKVCMMGAFISGCGLALASIVKNIMAFIATYSIMTGFGFGLMYIPSVVAVANHFTKWRSTAIGICLCGAGVGTFMLAPLEQYLTDKHGRKTAFLCLSLLSFFCVICGLVMRPVKFVPANRRPDGEPATTTTDNSRPLNGMEKVITLVVDRQLYLSPEFGLFMVIVLADVLATFGLFIPFHHLPPVAVDAGLSKAQAAFLISAIGMSSTVGRLFAGWLSDRPWLHTITIAAVAISCVVLPVFLLTLVSSYSIFLCLAISFGFLTGGWIAVVNPIFVHVLGLHLLTPAFGLLTALRGITALLGPPLAGQAVELSGDKKMALYTSGLFMSLSSLLFILALILYKRKTSRSGYSQI